MKTFKYVITLFITLGLATPCWALTTSPQYQPDVKVNTGESSIQLVKRRRGNYAGRGARAKRKNLRSNRVTRGNNAGGGSYVGFPNSNTKRYTKRNKGN